MLCPAQIAASRIIESTILETSVVLPSLHASECVPTFLLQSSQALAINSHLNVYFAPSCDWIYGQGATLNNAFRQSITNCSGDMHL